MDLVSFIFINRNGKNLKDAISNIKSVYNDLNKEILVIEQADNKPFMRGQLFNIGVTFANGKYIALSDNDMFHLRKVDWIKIYELYKKPLIGFKYISQITLKATGNYVITSTKECPNGFGGFNFMKKDDFINFNGFSNIYFDWGFEDNAYASRFDYIRIPQNLGHITHPSNMNWNNKHIILNDLNYKTNDTRNKYDDGYKQTTFKTISDITDEDIRTIKVTDISVCDDFKYIELIKEHNI